MFDVTIGWEAAWAFGKSDYPGSVGLARVGRLMRLMSKV
jgi:hypothetical protein